MDYWQRIEALKLKKEIEHREVLRKAIWKDKLVMNEYQNRLFNFEDEQDCYKLSIIFKNNFDKLHEFMSQNTINEVVQ